MTAHPRVGGENLIGDYITKKEGGSSPRRRGKLKAGASLLWDGRLIPA